MNGQESLDYKDTFPDKDGSTSIELEGESYTSVIASLDEVVGKALHIRDMIRDDPEYAPSLATEEALQSLHVACQTHAVFLESVLLRIEQRRNSK